MHPERGGTKEADAYFAQGDSCRRNHRRRRDTVPYPRVLVIDDSETDRLYAQIVLERCGQSFDVLAVESAREALDLLGGPDGGSVGLILLDINMPGMNGFEFLEAFERLPPDRRRSVIIVMLSSSPLPQDRSRALSHAAVRDYLTKPIDALAAAGLKRWLAA